MRATQHIFKVRRQYNKWVANEMLEDYALRYTAIKARRWSVGHVAQTAWGATAFMALEALAASITLNYGFTNAFWAILTVSGVIFLTGLPICYYAAKHGLDIDLLTRGAGFGYLGSTITSLIYAAFTFIFFAIEAAIMASALHALLGIPPVIGYIICSVAVIPIVTHGISAISRFQIGSQGLWLSLQIAALLTVVVFEFQQIDDWARYAPASLPSGNQFNLAVFGAAAAVLFALIAQIGEQVDFLRFMPEKNEDNKRQWWFWLIVAGPGWVFTGVIKMLLGSFLAYLAIINLVDIERATDPTYMYQHAFNCITHSPQFSLVLAATMVIISQMKINVTNAYAGSIAWSNFFSRLTHNHPGRVVWLVFNVAIALILMELGIYRALESVLAIFAIIAISWLGSVCADLLINKQLGFSPKQCEFKRARLYDINPVGVGSMSLASCFGIVAYIGLMGETLQSLAHFISLALCFVLAPTIAWLTKGKYYLARDDSLPLTLFDPAKHEPHATPTSCSICENKFEATDMSYCPAYQGAICSLCCSLDSRCLDSCKPHARLGQQMVNLLTRFVPARSLPILSSRAGRFLGIFLTVNAFTGAVIALIYYHIGTSSAIGQQQLAQTLWTLFFLLMIVFGVISWLFLLAHESREVAQQESNRQTQRLMAEIEAHKITDLSLQAAKEMAEGANQAKSRYLSGISHELRTPLQSMLGYAQLLTNSRTLAAEEAKAISIIQRSGNYLADLIEGLLDISKIEAGRLDIYRNEVKLPELLDQMVQMFSLQAETNGIEFIYKRPKYLPHTVITDEKRLRQILINLLSNAVKYTREGSVQFEINYDHQIAEFIVTDTGIGIHKDDMERILSPFERVQNPDLPHISGTGLGLTIVRLLTEVMGGQLSIDSSPGEGSIFRVALMLSTVAHNHKPLAKTKRIAGYHGDRLSIMVVDDEPIHRALLADLLKPLGFIVNEAASAETALRQIGAIPKRYDDHDHDSDSDVNPDAFLLDVSMPGMDGLNLATVLRTKGHTVPIIMISADARESHVYDLPNASHDAYLVKPINTKNLLEKLGELMGIDWLYDSSISSSYETTSKPAKVRAIEDHKLIRQLISYAESGFTKGVQQTLAEIEQQQLMTQHQLNTIKAMSAQFQFASLVQTLKLWGNS